MNLEDVAGELAAALATITGLRVPPWGAQSISAPAALVGLPERIEYDATYGRGQDKFADLPVVVLVAKPGERASRKALAAYAAGSGARSIKAAIEGHSYVHCDDVHVLWAEPDNARYAGTDYLAMIFHVDIVGKGATP